MTGAAGLQPTDPSRPGPLDPSVAVALLQRGQALAAQGDWAPAAATFGRVVGSNDPNLHTAALLGLAECRYRMDDELGALQSWITATQAPETPLSWRAWKALAAARVREGDLTGAARAYREAERRAPPDERAEIAGRLGWLAKESGDQGASKRYFARSRSGGAPTPIVTWSIMGLTVLIGGLALISPELDQLFFENLALTKRGVATGELWRLLSVVLVHGGILHLAFNMYALFIIGPIVEALYGPTRFLTLYLLCGAAGSAASYVFSDAAASVGASGAIFGLFGVLLVADRVHKPALTRNARNLTGQIGGLIAVNLAFGFFAGTIDNAAHIGGLVAGCWLGFIVRPSGPTLGSFWSNSGAPSLAQALVARSGWLIGALTVVSAVALAVAVGPVRLFG